MECAGEAYAGGGGNYDSGPESVQDSAAAALENWLDEEGFFVQIPQSGYGVERDAGDRVLLSFDVDGQTKSAVITAADTMDYDDDVGWGVESWAQCDPSEFPAAFYNELAYGVWLDASGQPAPVTEIMSFQGGEHCGWEDVTFLQLGGEDRKEEYLRDPSGKLADYLRTTYDGRASLPEDATDTGYRRDRRGLWLTPARDAAYLVSLDNDTDVELWPRATEPIWCA